MAKKVTAFVGSFRKRNTYQAVVQFMNNLQALGEVECEIIRLSDYQLGICKGCQVCVMRDESLCPLKDDRDVLFARIDASDGVIFATPNYSWNMSGMMKVFLDRFGFVIHRPRYFGKVFTSIVTQAMGRGDKIVEYLDYTAFTLGFNTLKGITITGFDPKTEAQLQKSERDLAKLSRRFHTLLEKPASLAPTWTQLLAFRMCRTMIMRTDPEKPDYRYYANNGWFNSDYYYATRLSTLKKAVGSLADRMIPVVQKLIV